MTDATRPDRISRVLASEHIDALVTSLPENVLVLTGYWPVVGTALAVATRHGISVLAPEDERDLAERGWAEVHLYSPGSLSTLTDPVRTIRAPLATLLRQLGVDHGSLAVDDGNLFEPASYASAFLYGAALGNVLSAAAPHATLRSALPALSLLRATLTPDERETVHIACCVAGRAFSAATSLLRPGRGEPEIAAAVQSRLEVDGLAMPGVARAGGFAWCMSGPNSASAGAAYARTRNRLLAPGDLVMIHCNSYIDGFWTDITRTYSLGPPHESIRAMYDAVFAARAAAMSILCPGVRGADVDAAARDALSARGFGPYFTHGLGHNVGFSSISTEFPPRLHPSSPDLLELGMTFNIEPAIYIPGLGGIRHCDVVSLTARGPQLLTTFDSDLDALTVR